MIGWSLTKKCFDLQYNWKLSRNETVEKTNFFVELTDGQIISIGEIAPNIRYKETAETVIADFDYFKTNNIFDEKNPFDFEAHVAAMPLSNCVKFGITSAYFHYFAQKTGVAVHEVLGLEVAKDAMNTCYTIPIMAKEKLKGFFEENNLIRFEALKVKVNKETGAAMIKEISTITRQPLYVDANESWTDNRTFLTFIKAIQHYNIAFIEQPFPSDFVEGYRNVKGKIPFMLMADESLTSRHTDFEVLASQFDGLNMKLQKAGGYAAGKYILEKARQYNMKTMVGCMVESTLGIGGAMMYAKLCDYCDLDGYLLIKEEPFNLVKEANGKLRFNGLKF